MSSTTRCPSDAEAESRSRGGRTELGIELGWSESAGRPRLTEQLREFLDAHRVGVLAYPSATFSGPVEIVTKDIGDPPARIMQRIAGMDEPPEPQRDEALAEIDSCDHGGSGRSRDSHGRAHELAGAR